MPEILLEDPGQPLIVESPDDLHLLQSPMRMAWRRFKRHRPGMVGLWVLGILYFMSIFAGFIAPYDYEDENRELQWARPTPLHFSDSQGASWRPFIHPFTVVTDENFNLVVKTDTT